MIGAAERRAGAIDVPKCPCQRRILLIASKTIKIEYLIQGHDIRLTALSRIRQTRNAGVSNPDDRY